jgi:hypothetical protein
VGQWDGNEESRKGGGLRVKDFVITKEKNEILLLFLYSFDSVRFYSFLLYYVDCFYV